MPDSTVQTESSGKAPILWPLLFWLVGLALGKGYEGGEYIFLAVSTLLVLAALFIPRLRLWLLLMLCLFAGILRVTIQSPEETVLLQSLQSRGELVQRGSFTVNRAFSDHTYEMGLRRFAGADMGLKLLLYHADSLQVGAVYEAIIRVRPLSRDPILDIYPSRYTASADLRAELKMQSAESRALPITQIRSWMYERLDRHASHHADIAKALLLSDQSAKKAYRQELQQGGMIHLIVVSGLHVWFIYAMLLVFLKGLLPRRLLDAFILLLLAGFAALNYWAAPITRALLMISIGVLARWLGRKVSSLQMLSLSLFIITLANPHQLFDLGLQLSFISVGIILLALPRIRFWHAEVSKHSFWKRGMERVANYLLLNLMVSLAILPLTLNTMGTGSLNGVFGNILGVPLIGMLLPLSILILIFAPSGIIGAGFYHSYLAVLWLFEQVAVISASLPFKVENFWIGLGPAIGMALLLLPFFIWLRRKKRPAWSFSLPLWMVGLLLLLVFPLLRPHRGGVWIFNCGTADCALIQSPSGHTILVDSGPGKYTWEAERDPTKALDTNGWAGRKLLPWLRHKGIRQLDDLILTHTHADHTGGVPALITSIPIKRLIITDELQSSQLYQLWREVGWFADTEVLVVADTLSLAIDQLHFKFLHPDRHWHTDNENDRSIVFRMQHKDKSLLFTGDIESASEAWLLNRYPEYLDVDYLKVAHHGSKTSSTEGFLRQVNPREAWISVGKRNRFNFPHPQALDRLQRYAPSIRYSYEGTIYLDL